MKKSPFGLIDLNGDSLGARTPDPLIKSQQGIMRTVVYLSALIKFAFFVDDSFATKTIKNCSFV